MIAIRRWCRWIAACAFVALAWPSLGPLPWLAAGFDAHGAAETHVHRDGTRHEHHRADASSIPGSPTHPVDHDCAECQVLKHLARCMPTGQLIASVPFASLREAPCRGILAIATPRRFAACVPPARAPPPAVA